MASLIEPLTGVTVMSTGLPVPVVVSVCLCVSAAGVNKIHCDFMWLQFSYACVFSFQAQRPEQSVMQALESLNDSQVRANMKLSIRTATVFVL